LLLLAGCGGNSSQPSPAPPSTTKPLTWIEKDIQHEGMTISLGYRGPAEGGERGVEPIATIIRDGQSVANAMVFCSLLSADDQAMGDEAATLYEPPAGKEPGLYTAGKMKLPDEGSRCTVRFRIVLPESEQDWLRDVEIPL
jgi:hypothetical protein